MTETVPDRIWIDLQAVVADDEGHRVTYDSENIHYEYVPATALEAAQERIRELEAENAALIRMAAVSAVAEFQNAKRTARREALEEAAKVLDRRVRKICDEVGSYDSTTNHVELPEWAETACEELETQAAKIRALMENLDG